MTMRDRPGAPSEEEAPVYDDPRAPARPPIQPFTAAFIAICVIVGIFDMVTNRRAAEAGLLFGPYVTQGEWWRVLTTAVLHGGLLHLGMNMMATYDLGGQLERAVGIWRIAIVTAVTALGSGAFVLLFSYDQATVGASGIICGFVGAMLPIATQHGRRILTSLVIQIAIISLLPFVSWQGHLGGFLFGLLCGAGLKFLPRRFAFVGAGLIAFAGFAVLVGLQLGPSFVRGEP